MNINKIFAFLIPFVLMVQSANSAIVSAEVVSGTGISTLTASGTITNIDGDGNNLVNDLSIARITFTIDSDDFITINGEVEGFIGYMYVLDGNNNEIFGGEDEGGYTHFSRLLSVGTYTVTLGVSGYLPEAALLGYDEGQSYGWYNIPGTNEEFGSWNLTITASSTEVPVPAALPLFLSALIGLASIARRR